MVKKEDPMSLAMEMAAVNNSILALVNPHTDTTSHDGEEDYDEEEHVNSFNRSQEHKQYHGNRPECRSFVA